VHACNVCYCASGTLIHSECYAESFVFQFSIQNLKIKIYRTIILPLVLIVCETWSLTLREERMLREFENRVLWRVFGTKRDEVTRGVEKTTF
jgi:hypothetical protein